MRDRLSFTRFLGLGFENRIPDGTTLWLFREKLAKAGLIDKLFKRFGQNLEASGYIARGGQMVDATIVAVPRQRNSRDENEQVKAGTTPKDWKKHPAKNRQKDKDARWTKKNGRSFFGYKNHVNADARHKLIRQYDVSDASVHDSQVFDALLNKGNTSSAVYADSAYRSAEIERNLQARGFRSRVHKRGHRNNPLSKAETAANTRKSTVRARIEHVFGAQEERTGRTPRAHDRHGASEGKDRPSESRLQYPPPRHPRASGSRVRGGLCPPSVNRRGGGIKSR